MKLILVGLFLFLAVQPFDQPAFCDEPDAAPKQELKSEKPDKTVRSPDPGYRGMGLEFDSDSVFYISPDESVDIITVTSKFSATVKAEKVAATLLKKVRVIAVKPSETNKGRSIVQFALNPYEAQYLELASHQGDIWLSLRKKGDSEDAPMQIASWKKFLADVIPLRSSSGPQGAGEAVVEEAAPVPAGSGADRPAIIAAVQDLMRGESSVALNCSIDDNKVMFVQVGDRIDVLATLDLKEPKKQKLQKTTLTLLQNIRVLDIRRSESHPGRSILLLEPNFNEAQYAALAWNNADVQVLSRNKKDAEIHSMQPATFDYLFR
ncbi:MAG: RcpC/CpaB family pilus assembly protein [Elusimicrobia bacterium]|nr:RcpC/CpaB family pilus assembly protein [Elusimicrobiota bacterium]